MNGLQAEQLSIRLLKDADIQRVKAWLYKEHIQKCYGDPCKWLAEINDRTGGLVWKTNCIFKYHSESSWVSLQKTSG